MRCIMGVDVAGERSSTEVAFTSAPFFFSPAELTGCIYLYKDLEWYWMAQKRQHGKPEVSCFGT